MSLQLSQKFSLPKEAVLWTFAFLAIRGAGKTYDAAKLAEQILKLGYPIVVFDPMGIWWGLRVGVNGHEGFPVIIVGGSHQDIPIPLQPAKKGFSVVDENKLRDMVNGILQAGLSVVVDTSALSSRTQQTRTVAVFADELFKRNARFGIRHVFIEEADVYVPQKPLGETQASHIAIDNLVRRGGNFNLGCTMISQRSAVIDKDVLSQANCLVALRILYVRDKDAIREWVKNAVKNEAEMKKLAKWYDSLKKLKNGEAWMYSPEHNDLFEKVQFGERETLHASREYFLQETWEQKNITLRDVTAFVKAYKARIEPKPTVQPFKPSVATVIGSRESDGTSNQAWISPEARIESRGSTPLVKTRETAGVLYPTVGQNPSWEHSRSTNSSSQSSHFTDSNVPSAKSGSQTEMHKRQSEKPNSIYEASQKDSRTMQSSESSIAERIPMSKGSRSEYEPAAKAASENSEANAGLGSMAVHIPSGETEETKMWNENRGALEESGRTQLGSTLGEAPQTIDILRSNPVIQTQRTIFTVTVPSDVDHPKTALGKIAVIMKDDSRHSQHWTLKRVRTNFEKRQWSTDGIEEAFNQLIAWGILRIQSNRAYTFYPSRVEITEKTVNVIAP